MLLNRSGKTQRDLLRGRTLINLFFEDSTRTRTSFELAGKRLGRRRDQHVGLHLLGEQGRDAARHRGHAERHALRPAGGAPRPVRRAQPAGAEGRCRRDQRRRRHARAPDPGAARRADHPPAQGPARRPDRRDLRRHAAFARRALQHPPAHHDGQPRARGRPADADAGRGRAAWGRGVPRHGARPRRRRHRDDAAAAARADAARPGAERARVFPLLRPRRGEARAAPSRTRW